MMTLPCCAGKRISAARKPRRFSPVRWRSKCSSRNHPANPHSAFRVFFFVLAGRRPYRDIGLLRRRRAQPLDKRWLNRVGLRTLAASAQLFHQTANA
jgi:hypothetical protein